MAKSQLCQAMKKSRKMLWGLFRNELTDRSEYHLGDIQIKKGLKSGHFMGENKIMTILNFFHHLTTGFTEIGRWANHLLFK